MVTNPYEFACQCFRLDPAKVTRVMPSLMPSHVRQLAEKIVKPQQCYDNCRQIIEEMHGKGATYCLAVCVYYGLPFQHAILKLDDDTYVDPTLEIINPDFDGTYIVTHELRFNEFVDALIFYGHAPDVEDMMNFKPALTA